MGGRFVPYGWSRGQSFSATSGSVTIPRIFERMNSAAVSLASLLMIRSLNEENRK